MEVFVSISYCITVTNFLLDIKVKTVRSGCETCIAVRYLRRLIRTLAIAICNAYWRTYRCEWRLHIRVSAGISVPGLLFNHVTHLDR